MKFEEKNKTWWAPAMELFAKISGWIIGPVILALFVGSWLDKKYDSGSKFLIIFVAIAFIITNIGLVLNVIKSAKQMEKESREEKEINNKK